MIRTLSLVVAFAVVALPAAACPQIVGAKALSADDPAAPRAFLSFDQPRISTPFEMIVEFCAASGGSVAKMKFDAIMPAHQHGMNYRADVSPIEGQAYRVSNVVFHMPGLWQVRIDADTAGATFKYSAEVDVE